MTDTLIERPSMAPVQTPDRTPRFVRIQQSSGWRALDLRELWRYRELTWTLAMRDISVRYTQTALGVAWALLQPLVAMAVFTLFFGLLIKVPTDGLPYPLLAFTGLLPWTYFANSVTSASGSLVNNANLISKVYFPRLVIPTASVLAGLPDLAIGVLVLLVLLLFFGVAPSWGLLLIPVFVALALLTAVSVGIWLSALDVRYRDVRYAIPFLIQIWLFATPVVYPVSVVPEAYRTLYGLNPMVGVVEGFRWAILAQTLPPLGLVGVSALATVLLFVSGLFYFRRVERTFADVI
jgi:lipopolysaccharide transport system permease protein